MARNALVIAIEILDGSKPTTAPLRRITLYWANRGSVLGPRALPVSPAMRSRVGADGVAAGEPLVTCIGSFSCRILVFVVARARVLGPFGAGTTGFAQRQA